MKLSEAIREGQKFPDIYTSYVGSGLDGTCRTCAIGGALIVALGDAFDRKNSYGTIQICEGVWPELKDIKIECPQHGITDSDGRESDCTEGGYEELDGMAQGNPFQMASHLFSDHKWSKAVVADWVAKEVESKLAK